MVLEQDLQARLDAINASMSTYLPNSEISRFNNLQSGEEFPVSADFAAVLEASQSISTLTGGSFDITVGPVVDLWGFGPGGKLQTQPTAEQIDELRPGVGYQKLELRGKRLHKSHSDTKIDLSAIAKGYAIDQLATILSAQQISNYLIEVGGELRASGLNGQGEIWRVAIEKTHCGRGNPASSCT